MNDESRHFCGKQFFRHMLVEERNYRAHHKGGNYSADTDRSAESKSDSRADKVCYDSAPFIFNLSPVIKNKARGVIGSNSEIGSKVHRSRKREEYYAEEH